MDKTTKERVAKLATSCTLVAADINSGKIRMKDLRRSTVFFDNSACGCAFGHAIARAGLKPRLAPFYIKGSAGGKAPRWIGNPGAYLQATGHLIEAGDPVFYALEEVELANDVAMGPDRRVKVISTLKAAAAAMLKTLR